MLTNCPLRFEISTESVFIFLRGDPFHMHIKAVNFKEACYGINH